MAAVAFAGSVSMNVLMFGMGIAMALTPPLTGQGFARGEHEDINAISKLFTPLNTIIGLIMISVLFLLLPLLDHFGQPKDVIEACKPYYIIISISFYQALSS